MPDIDQTVEGQDYFDRNYQQEIPVNESHVDMSTERGPNESKMEIIDTANTLLAHPPRSVYYHGSPLAQVSPNLSSSTHSHRYIGLDLGNTCSRLFYTVSDHSERRYSEPYAMRFEGNPNLLSLVIFKPGGGDTYVRRSDILSQASLAGGIQPFEANFKYRLESNDPRASRAIQVLATRFLEEFKSSLGQSSIDFNENLFTLSIPPEWEQQPNTIQNLLDAFEQAGFSNIHLIPDAVAVVCYHIFTGELRLNDKDQSWLVIDVGGRFTRFSHVKKNGQTGELSIVNTLRRDWGGDFIDEMLYNRILLQRYWRKEEPPNDSQKSILLLLVRDLKEQLAGSINEPKSAHRNFQFEGITERVEFTQPLFESSEVCQPLIREFQDLLTDPPISQSAGFQETDAVILNGGSANWYFVNSLVHNNWIDKPLIVGHEPELTVARGLSLINTAFTAPDSVEAYQPPMIEQPLPTIQQEQPTPSHSLEDSVEVKLMRIHKISRELVRKCLIAGALIALGLAWLPCGSWPFLLILEFYMFLKLTRNYNYDVKDSIFIILVIALIAISIILTLVIGVIVEFFPIINWALKPLIAALVVWGLGEGAIRALDKQSAQDGYRNIAQAKI